MNKLNLLLLLIPLLSSGPIYSQEELREYKINKYSKEFDLPMPSKAEKERARDWYEADITEWSYNNYIIEQDKARINSYAYQNSAIVSGINPIGNRKYRVTFLMNYTSKFVTEEIDYSLQNFGLSFENFKIMEKKLRFKNFQKANSEYTDKLIEWEDKLLELGEKRDEAVLKYREDISLNWISKFASLFGPGQYDYISEDDWGKKIKEGINDYNLRIVYELNDAFLENNNIVLGRNEDVEQISTVSAYVGVVPIIEKFRITVSNLFTYSPCSYNDKKEYEYVELSGERIKIPEVYKYLLDLNSAKYFVEGKQFSKDCSTGIRFIRDERYIDYIQTKKDEVSSVMIDPNTGEVIKPSNRLPTGDASRLPKVKYLGNVDTSDLKYYYSDDYIQTQKWFNNFILKNKEINFQVTQSKRFGIVQWNYNINVKSELKLDIIKTPKTFSEGYDFPEREYTAASLETPSILIQKFDINSIKYNVGIYKSFAKATETLPENIKSKMKPVIEAIYNPKSNISVWCKHQYNERSRQGTIKCPEWNEIINDYYKGPYEPFYQYNLERFPTLVMNTDELKFNSVTNLGVFEVSGGIDVNSDAYLNKGQRKPSSFTYIYTFQLFNDLLILERLSANKNQSLSGDGQSVGTIDGLFTVCDDKNYYNSSWDGNKVSNGDIPKQIFKDTKKALKKRK